MDLISFTHHTVLATRFSKMDNIFCVSLSVYLAHLFITNQFLYANYLDLTTFQRRMPRLGNDEGRRKCDKHCEWQNSANQENAERILRLLPS